MLEQKHTQEVDELKQALQLKTREFQQLASRLEERTEAASALSSELKEHKRVAEIQESKLRASLVDQKNKLERQYHQEKVNKHLKCVCGHCCCRIPHTYLIMG